ncbi:TetR/AcrR family transcriptional regulator [Streptomyces sp. NBC_00893]|uniref:TetR/AcrR family transcriptional regulator n=1 Tax=Streptomyces sp. NBC_00893 TaxID=2975862 RepID=UPI00225723F9|nr:TetR family transcriptional regulator [Streptomyces sp. NBC_00893]MCX4851106.1 TetR family transcriptional regulator [Streptomyces sp. NBC_00893]
MATGHTDPQRCERILTAALDLIAEEGTAEVPHRKIAACADVPLGSMTYHFSGIDEVLREAFRHFTGHIVALFDEHLAAPADADRAREAVAGLIHALSDGSRRDLILTQEPYTLAARQPSYRELTHERMARSRSHLEKHFDPDAARQLDALIEGLTLHCALATKPHDRLLTLDAVTRITGFSGATARSYPADHVAAQ